MNKSDSYWKPKEISRKMKPRLENQRQINGKYYDEVLNKLQKEVTKSQRGETQQMFTDAPMGTWGKKMKNVSGAALHRWFSALSSHADERRRRCNPEQKMR